MAYPERRQMGLARMLDTSPHASEIAGDLGGYSPGGPIGQIQAELARRLVQEGFVRGPANALPDKGAGERLVHFVSVVGGGLALLAAYAGVAILILR